MTNPATCQEITIPIVMFIVQIDSRNDILKSSREMRTLKPSEIRRLNVVDKLRDSVTRQLMHLC